MCKESEQSIDNAPPIIANFLKKPGQVFVFLRDSKCIEHDDEEHNMILFSKARGQSLFDRFIEIALSNFSNTIEKEDSLRQIEKTGRSIAKFHLHFKPNADNRPEFKTIVYGELHLGNIFVASEPNFEINFIDYETLARSSYTLWSYTLSSVNTDIARLFAFSKDTLKQRVEEECKMLFRIICYQNLRLLLRKYLNTDH